MFRRAFSPGDMVSYYSGQSTTSSLVVHNNMTEEQFWKAIAYTFNFALRKSFGSSQVSSLVKISLFNVEDLL